MHPSIYGKRRLEAQKKIAEKATILGKAVDLEPQFIEALDVHHRDPEIVHLFTLEAVANLLEQLADRALPVEETPKKKPSTRKPTTKK